MPCLMGCLALSFPRVALFLVWFLGGNYIDRAFGSWLWPVIGFFVAPLTTLAFAYGQNSLSSGGEMSGLGWLLVVLALLCDLGLLGGGGQSAQRWKRDR
jgi:hypothetical protein